MHIIPEFGWYKTPLSTWHCKRFVTYLTCNHFSKYDVLIACGTSIMSQCCDFDHLGIKSSIGHCHSKVDCYNLNYFLTVDLSRHDHKFYIKSSSHLSKTFVLFTSMKAL